MKRAHDKKIEEFAAAVKPKAEQDTPESIEAEERMRHNARVKIINEAANKEEAAKFIAMAIGILLFSLYAYFVGF